MTKNLTPLPDEAKKEALRLAEELRSKLPTQFELSARPARNGETQYPSLVFKADPNVPGLFRAEVDPDLVMSRFTEPQGFEVHKPESEKR